MDNKDILKLREEIDEIVLDGSRSVAFDQAENRLYAQKAILHNLYST